MQNEQFETIVKARLEKIHETLLSKADEYARGDRLSNFKKMGELLNCTPERALIGLVSKHYIALVDFIADLEAGVLQSDSRWDEKIGDVMAYMVLLDAMIQERNIKAE